MSKAIEIPTDLIRIERWLRLETKCGEEFYKKCDEHASCTERQEAEKVIAHVKEYFRALEAENKILRQAGADAGEAIVKEHARAEAAEKERDSHKEQHDRLYKNCRALIKENGSLKSQLAAAKEERDDGEVEIKLLEDALHAISPDIDTEDIKAGGTVLFHPPEARESKEAESRGVVPRTGPPGVKASGASREKYCSDCGGHYINDEFHRILHDEFMRKKPPAKESK